MIVSNRCCAFDLVVNNASVFKGPGPCYREDWASVTENKIIKKNVSFLLKQLWSLMIADRS
ncbi:MAG: hypothetical protein COW66_13230 [Flavobacteriaceae bacterium CG18_big_fil_WC_8_21_14_2_50_34_36]|nr:MAG: hypothetical protein COW66_13230 [Flavobacteriaceae bacterium CG18_big_fil_WC_8_21_14_2_50_34_36]